MIKPSRFSAPGWNAHSN